MHLSVEFRFSVDVIYDGYWSWIPSSMEVISIQGDFSFVVFSALVKLLNGNFEKKRQMALWNNTEQNTICN